ncbi:cupin domain-containing protein [Parahaliea maris]|uniref:Cupin domain-containing protein n=1 Tax=Parahaliea maris TaxID=2716870 RepID=A0A5C8ZWQ8_9GAMM|nr:cupin domain-containing protein [Parahaliea maris]TXS92888.1 cupin domain-containing protein [Parahaliea maris]
MAASSIAPQAPCPLPMPPTKPLTLPIDIEHFLAEYWQRKPLLIRNAIADFEVPLDADELAGLAMEAEVESRIVEEAGGAWALSHGPFTEADFQRPPPWTLLVQAVDQFVPEVAALQQLAAFIPQWRADDVMVSYATDGGSVGPHFDYYDVFLLQGEGERLWRLGQHCDSSSPLLAGCDMRVLEHFECQQECLLEPGDLLYVPPGLAHWGIARGECTTFSIGFRAPARRDLLARLTDTALDSSNADNLLADPQRAGADRSGEITATDLENARRQAIALLQDEQSPHWFGELVTEPRYDLKAGDVDEADIRALLKGETPLYRDPTGRLAWTRQGDDLVVFANGASCDAPGAMLPWLTDFCARGQADCGDLENLHPQASGLLYFLLESGAACIDG